MLILFLLGVVLGAVTWSIYLKSRTVDQPIHDPDPDNEAFYALCREFVDQQVCLWDCARCPINACLNEVEADG